MVAECAAFKHFSVDHAERRSAPVVVLSAGSLATIIRLRRRNKPPDSG